MYSLLCLLICVAVQYSCLADLYQVNRTRTLCYSDVAEFICSQLVDSVAWRVVRGSTQSTQLTFYAPSPGQRVKSLTFDSTPVTAQLIFGNSSYFKSSLTIVATLSVIIRCNSETIMYNPQDKSQAVPSEIILTPTTSGSSSYTITWTSSYYNSSDYMIIVYPPESYTQEHLIINTDNSTVYNITVALKYCPHKSYSTFVLGCKLGHISEVINYTVTVSGKMNANILGYHDNSIQCINSWENVLSTISTMQDTPIVCKCTDQVIKETSSNSLLVILSVVGTCCLTVIIHVIIIVLFMIKKMRKCGKYENEALNSTNSGDEPADQLKNSQITINQNAAYSTFRLHNTLPILQETIEGAYDVPIVPIYEGDIHPNKDINTGVQLKSTAQEHCTLPPKLPPRTTPEIS